jgi:hypothetical protein
MSFAGFAVSAHVPLAAGVSHPLWLPRALGFAYGVHPYGCRKAWPNHTPETRSVEVHANDDGH